MPDFQFEAAMLILTAMSAAVGALTVSVPGARALGAGALAADRRRRVCILWVGGELVFASVTGAPTGRLTFAWRCVYKTTSVALVPGIALFVLVRRAAPLRAAWAGLLAVLATAAVGVLGANVICPIDRPLHLLLWHVAPLMLVRRGRRRPRHVADSLESRSARRVATRCRRFARLRRAAGARPSGLARAIVLESV